MLFKSNHSNIDSTIRLPGSKSISNRLLILNSVLNLNLQFQNLSSAQDTRDLIAALAQIKENKNPFINIGHAGTDMRFLTALLSITPGEWILTGSERMKQRPIAELVNALKQIGAQISYTENEGFPPLKITGKIINGGSIEIDGSISSQFISALMLIAPALEDGLEINIKNEIVSWSYIKMTIDILKQVGINILIREERQKYQHLKLIIHNSQSLIFNPESLIFSIESDWSSASYWYSIVALSKRAEITLLGLNETSNQGDSVLPELYKHFGVTSEFKNGDLILTKNNTILDYFEYNFSDCPDIAQTIAVTCLGLKINCSLTGLSTLKVKETDRIMALKNELEKFGASVEITKNSISINNESSIFNPKSLIINTYNDHRMAMSFAPLALICDSIRIQHPEVVEKSYPNFWKDLKSVGINPTN
ncbi:MAG: 3-phosphoshikimate 1-carboxyvinyltransferase [Bacteroidota bacterium]|nr:3-phosphoshikimate 1-carboxyvinyltransferase [Bacteroidota bacterium]